MRYGSPDTSSRRLDPDTDIEYRADAKSGESGLMFGLRQVGALTEGR